MTAVPRISGAARVGGIVGQPVAHSLSPAIHNAWIAAAGFDAAYVPFAPRDADGFEALVAAGRAGLVAGLNITAPFKEQAFAVADGISDTARAAGSANLLVFRDGLVFADSTDGEGLVRALETQAPRLILQDARVVVLGAGGASRAALASLLKAGARLSIVNRTRERADRLAADIVERTGAASDRIVVADYADVAAAADLVINALSARPEVDLGRLPDRAVVMDMTYRPLRTPFLSDARKHGFATVDGLAMLIGQAAPSFEAIFDQPAPDLDPRPLLLEILGETD